jgi:hypothetical protein
MRLSRRGKIGLICRDLHPSSDPGAAFQGNFWLAINSLGTLKAPPGVVYLGGGEKS